MGKMHELLAVEASVTSSFHRDTDETQKVFGRGDLFTRTVTQKKHFDSSSSHLDTVVTKEITTKVKDRLNWYSESGRKFLDVILQKDLTNQSANADLEVDGVKILNDVPATTLLALETKLQDLRKVFETIPTLQSGVIWEKDENEGLYRAREPAVTFSTKKVTKPVVLYEATKEHPAQVKEVSDDIPVAKITVDTYSGMITSAQKADILTRLDKLLQEVKKSRQRANATPVVEKTFGKEIFDYLLQGVK